MRPAIPLRQVPLTPAIAAWRSLIDEHRAHEEKGALIPIDSTPMVAWDEEVHAIEKKIAAASEAIWRRPVRTLEDVVLLAEVAGYWFSDEDDIDDMPDHAAAHLAAAVALLAPSHRRD